MFFLTPLFRYLLISPNIRLSLIHFLRIFISNLWLSVSMHLDKSNHHYIFVAFNLHISSLLSIAFFAILCSSQPQLPYEKFNLQIDISTRAIPSHIMRQMNVGMPNLLFSLLSFEISTPCTDDSSYFPFLICLVSSFSFHFSYVSVSQLLFNQFCLLIC